MPNAKPLLAYIEGVVDERKQVLDYLMDFADDYEDGEAGRELLYHVASEIAHQHHYKGGRS